MQELNEQPIRAAELVGAIPFRRPEGDGIAAEVAGILLAWYCGEEDGPKATYQLAIRATDVPQILESITSVLTYWVDPEAATQALALNNALARAELRRQGRGGQAE